MANSETQHQIVYYEFISDDGQGDHVGVHHIASPPPNDEGGRIVWITKDEYNKRRGV